MSLQTSLQRLSENLAWLGIRLRQENEMGFFDLNRVCEDVFVPVFTLAYGYSNLINLNTEKENFPAIDLGDPNEKVAIQITSDASGAKVKDTLEKFVKNELYEVYDHLIIYILIQKQGSYTGTGWNEIINGRFDFDKDVDIIDHTDLYGHISRLTPDLIDEIVNVLELYIGNKSSPNAVEIIRDFAARQLEREKRRKRYIPEIFIEVGNIKDRARYFTNPLIFLNRTQDHTHKIHINELNRILHKLELPSIEINEDIIAKRVSSTQDLEQHIGRLREELQRLHREVNKYSDYSTPAFDPNLIPAEKQYLYRDMRFRLGWTASGISLALSKSINELNLISGRVMIILGKAGQGKTNFVCDLVESTLVPRGNQVVFFTGQDFNHTDPSNLDTFLTKSIFGDQVDNFTDALRLLDEIAHRADSPLIILIDGINEHTDIASFSYHLERLIERIIQYSNIKVILTCRSEYFAERFENLRDSSFNNKSIVIDDFDRQMTSANRVRLVRAYFDFFKIEADVVTKKANEILQNDTLLLRMFCEAYGDPASEERVQIPSVVDIYRDKVFRKYLERKIESASYYIGTPGPIGVGKDYRFREVLARIIEHMLTENKFSHIPLSLFVNYSREIGILLGEDLIIRKDLRRRGDVLDNSVEVLNFTFDEFRDFLLANHLVETVYSRDPGEFEKHLDKLVSPESPVAEGVRTYVFHASKYAYGKEIDQILKQKDWYEDEFIKSIFSVEEDFITPTDLTKIAEVFKYGQDKSSWVIRMLIMRWRCEHYPTLNIRHLVNIFEDLDDNEMVELVYKAFHVRDNSGFERYSVIRLEELATDIQEALEHEKFRKDPNLPFLMEAIVFLTPIMSTSYYAYPMVDTFMRFSEIYPDVAISILSKHCAAKALSVRESVWKILGHLAVSYQMSDQLVTNACDQIIQIQVSPDLFPRMLGVEISRFLDNVTSSSDIAIPVEVAKFIHGIQLYPKQ